MLSLRAKGSQSSTSTPPRRRRNAPSSSSSSSSSSSIELTEQRHEQSTTSPSPPSPPTSVPSRPEPGERCHDPVKSQRTVWKETLHHRTSSDTLANAPQQSTPHDNEALENALMVHDARDYVGDDRSDRANPFKSTVKSVPWTAPEDSEGSDDDELSSESTSASSSSFLASSSQGISHRSSRTSLQPSESSGNSVQEKRA